MYIYLDLAKSSKKDHSLYLEIPTKFITSVVVCCNGLLSPLLEKIAYF